MVFLTKRVKMDIIKVDQLKKYFPVTSGVLLRQTGRDLCKTRIFSRVITCG